MCAQYDLDVHESFMLEYFSNTGKVTVEDQMVTVKGQSTNRKLTTYQAFCSEWKDDSTSWKKFSNHKNLAQGIEHDPAINQWIHHVLKKTAGLISL